MPTTAPYGSWKSPITSDLIVSNVVDLSEITVEGETIYWIEMRPEEEGRYCVVRRLPDGRIEDLLSSPWNLRTRVHEYGGGSYLIDKDTLYFINFSDQRLHRMLPGGEPEPLTPPSSPSEWKFRFADLVSDAPRNRLIAIREAHSPDEKQVINTIVAISLDGGDLEPEGRVLVSGKDFYSTPRLSPDGGQLTWLQWSHPNMPWDGCELWLAQINDGGDLENAISIAGGPAESIFQPSWSPDGSLYFVSDRTGWWNLYRWQHGEAQPIHPLEAEFGGPQWRFDASTYSFESADRLICVYQHGGQYTLAALDTRTLDFRPFELPFTDLSYVTAMPGRVLFFGGSPVKPLSLIRLDLEDGHTQELRKSTTLSIDPGYLSNPEQVEFPTRQGLTAFANYYPPHNKDFVTTQGELPPLIVLSHGGPTGSASTTFNLSKQYWTSRGFAIVDVNYGGSTGYGRAYRERLKGQFGVVDVDDCVNAASFLVHSSRADPQRLAIRGGSAGGYTTLSALTFRKIFKAGASLYGISDIETLAIYTHKFESHYLDNLIGPYPQAREVYIARSPIHFIDQLDCALILFQGAEDKIVPPDQSREMYQAVRQKGLPVAYLEFPGEGHGFLQAGHIKRALDAEYFFYSKVFGFTPADPVEPVLIENLT